MLIVTGKREKGEGGQMKILMTREYKGRCQTKINVFLVFCAIKIPI